jgi:hypothetical protein
MPIDTLSFLEDEGGYLNVLLRATGPGDAMGGSERGAGAMALLRVPVSEFGDGRGAAREAHYRTVPGVGGPVQNRWIGPWLLWGGVARGPEAPPAWALRADEGGSAPVALSVGHGIERIEALGPHDVLAPEGEELVGEHRAAPHAGLERAGDGHAVDVRVFDQGRGVAGDDREFGGEAGGHVLEIAVPSAPHGAPVEADRLVVERVERREQQGASVGGRHQQWPPRWWPVGEEREPVEPRRCPHRERELAALKGECPRFGVDAAFGAFAGCEHGPTDHGLIERAGVEAVQFGDRFEAEHEHRGVAVRADRRNDVAAVHDDDAHARQEREGEAPADDLVATGGERE